MDHPTPADHASRLPSLREGATVVVVGAHGGIGRALTDRLGASPRVSQVHAWSRHVTGERRGKVIPSFVDIADESTIELAVEKIESVDLVLVATGLLHSADGMMPEKTWKTFSGEQFAKSFLINSIGPALIAKHVLPLMPRKRRAIFAALSARVGSISDNRLGGWYSYRAAKAALNQIIKTLSIELARSHPQAICVGLHPGTVDTGLSKPFQTNVPAEKLFGPEVAADQLLGVVDGLTPADTGGVFAWDGQRVPH